MTAGQYVREALVTVRSSRVPSALLALLTAVMCAATLATVGRTVSSEREIQARMDAAGSRVIVFRDLKHGDLFPPELIDAAAHLSVTERAVGLSAPRDVVNGAIGPGSTPAPAWRVVGEVPAVAELTVGRWPRPGEALVSETARSRLGLAQTYGWLSQGLQQVPVVGAYRARAPFEDLADGVLVAAAAGDQAVALHVVATHASDARQTESTLVSLIGTASPQDLALESPETLADLQERVGRDLGGFNRSLLLGVMAAGALLTAIVVFADVLVRRKDIGRRRALGASRTTIIVLVLLRTAYPAVLGAVLGTVLGLVAAAQLNAQPGLAFTTAVATLAVLAASTSTLAPAVYAAWRDPVVVLRTP